MGTRSTIIALLLALLSVGAMVYTLRTESRLEHRESNGTKLFTSTQLPVDQVVRITLKRRDEPALVFERREGQWKQTAPFEYPMDAFSIRQFAVAAFELTVSDTLDADKARETAAALGFDPPAAEVTYEWPDESRTLQLGRTSVAGRAYLRIKGDPRVYVVGQKLHERAIESDPKEWRERTLFENVGVDSNRIEWRGQTRVVLERSNNQWRMLEPVPTRLDPEARDRLFQALGRAQAAGFILDQADDLTRFGLNPPTATMTIARAAGSASENGGSIVQRLLIGARAGAGTQDRFGLIEGRQVVLRVSAATIAALFRQPQTLVALTGSGIQPADVKSIVIRSKRGEFRLERDLERWRAPGHDNVEVKSAHVQELLDQLTGLRAPEVELREYPRNQELATVTFQGFDGRPLDTVRIAQEPNEGRVVLENGDNVLRLFSPALKIRLNPQDFGLQ